MVREERKSKNEIARFAVLRPLNPAISILPVRQKQILNQWADRCSRTTTLDRLELAAVCHRRETHSDARDQRAMISGGGALAGDHDYGDADCQSPVVVMDCGPRRGACHRRAGITN